MDLNNRSRLGRTTTTIALASYRYSGASAMYSGAIENGQMHGPGRLQYANGDVFEVRRRPGRCAARRARAPRRRAAFSRFPSVMGGGRELTHRCRCAPARTGNLGVRQAPRQRFVHLPRRRQVRRRVGRRQGVQRPRPRRCERSAASAAGAMRGSRLVPPSTAASRRRSCVG